MFKAVAGTFEAVHHYSPAHKGCKLVSFVVIAESGIDSFNERSTFAVDEVLNVCRFTIVFNCNYDDSSFLGVCIMPLAKLFCNLVGNEVNFLFVLFP